MIERIFLKLVPVITNRRRMIIIIGLVLIVLGVVSLLVGLRRRAARGGARWLMVPAVLGVVGFLAVP